MTNHWIDLKNANVHLIMGSNAVENHPIASYWIWKAKEENNATIIHVDPRFTRTSAKADIYAPMRSGTDIVFLGGMIRWAIEKWYESGKKKYINRKYVEDCTNALLKVRTDFKTARDPSNPGNFSAKYTWDYDYDPSDPYNPTPGSTIPIRVPKKATSLDDADCVFQKLRNQYSAYTPEMVQRICGTPAALFEQICEAYIGGTYKDDKAGTMLYAMGWTQHTVGTQNIRTATIVQSLLGNIGVAGGGVDALRGWHNVQGATDHALLYHYIPGYMGSPEDIPAHDKLGTGPLDSAVTGYPNSSYLKNKIPLAIDPYPTTAPGNSNWWGTFATQQNTKRYAVSLLKAWWPGVDHNTSWSYLPKRKDDYSYLSLIKAINDVTIKGLFCWGTNPMVMGPDQNYERGAMDKLAWLVVCDCFETETANFWKRPGLTSAQILAIPTDVYFLPGAYAYEKEGSATNSGRLAQWRDKACDPPKPTTDPTYPNSGAKDELDIVKLLGDKFIPGGGNPIADNQIINLAWPYNTNAAEFQPGATLAESVAKEINGYALLDFTRPVIYGNTAAYTKKDQINSFFDLMDNGQTACGNWLFCGTWQKAANPRTGNYNQMKNRRPIDDHPAQIGIYRDWGYSWPVNRRIIYNRASVYQSGPDFGKPLNPSKWVLWWDATRTNPAYPSVPTGNFDGGCVTGQANDVADGHALSSPSVYMPFIMREEGLARLMGKGTGLTDGVFPEHWEPWETPLDTNPLTGGVGPLVSPYAYPYPGASYADTPGDRDAYPIVCTTYRLTEHWHGGGFTRNCPTQFEAQPEPFVEMSVELADELGIANAELVKVSSIRGSINLKACVTKRWKPFVIDGEVIHEVGVPWHWGFAGWNSAPNGTANMLTPFIGDTNTRIPETKVFLVKIEKIP